MTSTFSVEMTHAQADLTVHALRLYRERVRDLLAGNPRGRTDIEKDARAYALVNLDNAAVVIRNIQAAWAGSE